MPSADKRSDLTRLVLSIAPFVDTRALWPGIGALRGDHGHVGRRRLAAPCRTYLERIFSKTRTRQQSELVALLKSTEPLSGL